VKLSEKLTEERIRIPLAATTKAEVLAELVGLLPAAADPERRRRILEAVVEREQRMSTGIGQGIAIPHGKCGLVGDLEVACGLASKPIPFDALDGEPCSVFFLLVSPPEMSGPHIQALARISRMLGAEPVRKAVAGAGNAAALLEVMRREEADAGD